MERSDALILLPAHYEAALRLADAGTSEQTIATALGIEPTAVGPLLKIAEAKLQRVLAESPSDKAEHENHRTDHR